MDENYIGIAMGMDVSDLKAGISEANKQIQLANSKFKAATAGMEDWTKSTEGLNAKIQQLGSVLDMQKKKLAGMEAEYKKVAAEQGENSEAARKLQVQINNQIAVVKKTEREYRNYKETLVSVENGSLDLEKASLRAGKAVEKAGKDAEEAGDGFTIAKGAIAGFIANGLTALVGAAKNGISTILGLAEATREYRQTLATLETAADDAGVNADKMRDKFTDLMGVFNDEGSVTEGLNNLLAAGFDEKTIDQITEQLEGAAIKFKDTLKFEGLSDGLQETLATGAAVGPFSELLERSGVSLEKFDEGLAKCTTDAQKQNYVLNELSKLGLADVSKSYRNQNKDMIAAQQASVEYQDTVAQMGEKVEPITTKIQQGFTKILEKILELVGGVDMEAFGASIDSAFSYVTDTIIPAIVDGFQWILDNKDAILAGIVGIGAAFLAWKVVTIIQGIVKAFKAWQLATEGMTVAQRILNLVMKANPIGLVISLITGLIAAFVLLWNNCEGFRNFWIGLWEKIKTAAGAVAEWFKNTWNAVIGWFKNLWAAIDLSATWSKLKKGASDAWAGVKNTFSKVGSFFGDTFRKAWQKVKDVFSTGGKIFDGIKDGIVTAFKTVVNAIIRGINKVVSAPFKGLNKILDKLQGISIAGIDPFSWLTWRATVPEIPELFRGGVLKKGQVGLLEGKGTEAVVPLEKNLGWIRKIAAQMADFLSFDLAEIKGGLASANGGLAARASKSTVINAGMEVHYNGKLSRKELKRIEKDNYTSVRTRLRAEGLV